MERLAVIGSGFAGRELIRQLRAWERDFGSRIFEIYLFDPKKNFELLPLLPEAIGRDIPFSLLQDSLEIFSHYCQINFINQAVQKIDLQTKQLFTDEQMFNFDLFVLATGSEPICVSKEGLTYTANIFNSIETAQRLKNILAEDNFDTVLVAGAGYTGIELVTNLWLYFKKQRRFKRIILLEKEPTIANFLPFREQNYIIQQLNVMGIEIYCNNTVEETKMNSIKLHNGEQIINPLLI